MPPEPAAARRSHSPARLRELRRELAALGRALPSLDLRRRQVAARLAAERALLSDALRELRREQLDAAARLPMLAGATLALEGKVRLRRLRLATELVAGVALPALEGIDVDVESYSRIATPFWMDGYVEAMQRTIEAQARASLRERRVARLEDALRRATRRVNLLEKLLIPRTERAVREIGIFIADAKRAEVVRAKIAKRRHADRHDRAPERAP